MTCPACRAPLAPGQEACAACGATVAPAVEGSLAPDPAKGTAQPLRRLPGLRQRDRTWKDEVRDRVRKRRAERNQGGRLPLFDDADGEGPPPAVAMEKPARSEPRAPAVSLVEDGGAGLGPSAEADRAGDVAVRSRSGVSDLLVDLPLRTADEELQREPEAPAAVAAEPDAALAESTDPAADTPPATERQWRRRPLAEGLAGAEDFEAHEPEADGADPDWSFEPSGLELQVGPLERPSSLGERALAALLDSLAVALLFAAVVYFAGRAARVPLAALAAAWPWLLGYLAFLALVYAAFFTGATGQTPGKIVTGQRVVDRVGRPPGFLRALARASLGLVGTLGCGLGLLPMLFDPARRSLHDRVFGTRVVRW